MGKSLKVALIGGASVQWAHTISRDIIVALSDERVCDTYDPVLVMEDVDGGNLEIQARLARIVAEKAGSKVKVEHTTDQRRACADARFVVVTIAQGTLEAMQHDIDIPQQYGIYHPVGDTISIGGAIRAARNIPAMLSIARDMEQISHKDAWMLNLSNPMSILCRAVSRESKIRIVGNCHELYGGMRVLSKWLGFDYDTWRKNVTVEVLGVNHCGWLKRMRIGEEDGLAKLRAYLAGQDIEKETQQLYNSSVPHLRRQNVKINLFLRHGVLPYSGDRHTSEFFTEFLGPYTNKGADYGVLLTSAQERLVEWRGSHRQRAYDRISGAEEIKLDVSQEACSKIIRAVVLDESFYDVGNIPYSGDSLPGIPQGAVIERMVTYTKDGAVADPVTPLPEPVQQHMSLITGMIEDIVKACVNGNRPLLCEALQRDPLLQNMPQEKIPELVDLLLEKHREYVHPGFF